MHKSHLTAVGLMTLVGAGLACSDDETAAPTTSTTTSSASVGGGGGTGGDGGGPGAGGGGSSPCLDASAHEDVFTFAAAGLCVVETFEAPFAVASYAPPTWGRHGGPMTLVQAYAGADPADEITLTRWMVAGDVLSAMETVGPLGVGASPSPYFASIATDLPGTPWTFVAYSDATFAGELIALDGETVADRWDVNGYYWGTTVGETMPRLVHTSQGALGDSGGATAGLHAADFCAGPTLCDGSAITVDTWGNATGPVTSDRDGNVFAIQTDFVASDQTLRGFAAAAIEAGAPATTGTDMMTVPGFGSSLAAIAPEGEEAGWVLFQPQTFDGNAVVSEDVLGVRFTIEGQALAVAESAAPLLALTTPGTEVTLMLDDQGRVWVGVATGPASSTFFVVTSSL